MRSDYYHNPLISVEPPPSPAPEQAPPPRKKPNHAVPLFLLVLALLAAGTFYLGWLYHFTLLPLPELPVPSQLPQFFQPEEPTPSPEDSQAVQTMLTVTPPGERSLTLIQGAGEPLSANQIHAVVSPSILSITAWTGQNAYNEGTGVIFDSRGYFITNAHVVEGASEATVTLSDGRSYPAFLLGLDSRTDLAVLRFSGKDLPVASFAGDDSLSVGETVYAIGNPLGSRFQGSITDGIISAIGRSVMVDGNEMSLLQTTAPLNQGSSGGALVDGAGRVVGITNMKMMSWASTVEGLGFAIPSSTVEKVVNDLMELGYVTGRPMLGVTVRPATREESPSGGLYVAEVEPLSDAWAKGLRTGDVLLYANGVPLVENDDLLEQRTGLEVGESVSLSWLSPSTHSLRTAQVKLVEEHSLTGEG